MTSMWPPKINFFKRGDPLHIGMVYDANEFVFDCLISRTYKSSLCL
jgi:hypothetical protein